jgi:hypothetical protein
VLPAPQNHRPVQDAFELPRLRDVGHHEPRASGRARRPEAGASPHPLRDARDGLTPTAKFRKSATVVGDVLGKYHPHGDASVYDAMVKLAQDFSTRYPLVLGQGTSAPSTATRRRHTLHRSEDVALAESLLNDLEKETVEWNTELRRHASRSRPCFRQRSRTCSLNGTLGIAVGMATNIPPHNLREVVERPRILSITRTRPPKTCSQFVKGPTSRSAASRSIRPISSTPTRPARAACRARRSGYRRGQEGNADRHHEHPVPRE